MDYFNISDRYLIVVGQPDGGLLSVVNSCCLLPEPFFPTKICWFLDEKDQSWINDQIKSVDRAFSGGFTSQEEPLEFLYFERHEAYGYIHQCFSSSVVQPYMQQMVVCADSESSALLEILPLFNCYARDADSLVIINRSGCDDHSELVEVPVVRQYYSATAQPARIEANTLYSRMKEWARPAILTIRPDSQTVIIDGKVIGLSPLLFAFYFWLARRRKQCQHHPFPHGGLVRYDKEDVAQEFLSVYRHYCDDLSSHYEKAQFLLQHAFPKNYFLEKVSLIRSALREVLGSQSDMYSIHGVGKRNEMQHGILLHPEFIRFER